MAESAAPAGAAREKHWLPLESNPDVLRAYVEKLGWKCSEFDFADVLGCEDWAYEMVPRPVLAVLFLYPIKEATEAHRAAEAARIEAEGQVVSDKLIYMKQYVGNACGTIALLHAMANATDHGAIEPGSWLERFVREAAGKTPEEVARIVEESDELEASHGEAAEAGQSSVPNVEDDVDTHFICFTQVGGHLYELDGRKRTPINHGPSSADTLLQDAGRVISQAIARDPGEMRFTIMALAKAQAGEED